MSFVKKVINWLKGKGFQEEEIKEEIQQIKEEIQKEETKKEEEKKEIQKEPKQEEKEKEKEEKQQKREQKQKEEKETKERKPILKKKEKTEKTQKKEQKEEIKKAIKRIETKPKTTTYERNLNNETVVKGIIPSGRQTLNDLRPEYENIFRAKILQKEGVDSQILDILVENRDRLRHRFVTEIEIWIDGKLTVIIKHKGLLPEESQMIYDYLSVGQKVTSDELKIIIAKLNNSMENTYGSQAMPEVTNGKMAGFISDIIPKYNFA